MNHLHLVLPDLFLPREIPKVVHAGLQLPSLEKILRRGERTELPAMTVEDVLCKSLAADSVAPVRAKADGLEVKDKFWLCADPVHLQLQQSQVMVQPHVACTTDEAAALCATLNEHFSRDGLSFFAPHPQRWYLCTKERADVTLTPLRIAAWRDARSYQPQGKGALHWQGISNEIQMLLHDHPVNQARATKGLAAINSVWLWGGGNMGTLQPTFDVVGGDDELSLAFARAAAVPCAASLPDMLDGQGLRGLWVTTVLSEALQREDLYAWHVAAQQLEHEISSLIWQAMSDGRLQSLTLDVLSESVTRRFELNRAGLWKVWRRSRPLANYSV